MRSRALASMLLLLCACPDSPPPAPPAPVATVADSAPPEAPPRVAPAPASTARFKHRRSAAVASLGTPLHGAEDVILMPGEPGAVTGKFAYGSLAKDLEDEPIFGFIAVGGARRALGQGTTDDEGLCTFKLPKLSATGSYAFELTVAGDGSKTEGLAWVVDKGKKAVVFDIDGTLTTGDDELFDQILAGKEGDMRPGADQVVRWYQKKGYQPIYITGRPRVLSRLTRAWLSRHGFPPAPLLLARSKTEALPTEEGVQRFKRTVLEDLQRRLGLAFVAAYGNAVTDICAYAQAGIDPKQTFIAGDHGGKACAGHPASQKLPGGYPRHLETLR